PRGRVAVTPALETVGGRPSSALFPVVAAVVPMVAVEVPAPVRAQMPVQGQGVRPVRSGLTRARDGAASKAGKTPRPRAIWEAVVPDGVHRGSGVNAEPPSGGRVRHPPGEEVTGQAAKEAG